MANRIAFYCRIFSLTVEYLVSHTPPLRRCQHGQWRASRKHGHLPSGNSGKWGFHKTKNWHSRYYENSELVGHVQITLSLHTGLNSFKSTPATLPRSVREIPRRWFRKFPNFTGLCALQSVRKPVFFEPLPRIFFPGFSSAKFTNADAWEGRVFVSEKRGCAVKKKLVLGSLAKHVVFACRVFFLPRVKSSRIFLISATVNCARNIFSPLAGFVCLQNYIN